MKMDFWEEDVQYGAQLKWEIDNKRRKGIVKAVSDERWIIKVVQIYEKKNGFRENIHTCISIKWVWANRGKASDN